MHEHGHRAHRAAYLQASAQKNGLFQSVERLPRKFHADGEQQHGHAEIGDGADGLLVRDDVHHRRAAEEARQKKTYRGSQLDFVADKADDDGQQKQQDQVIDFSKFQHGAYPYPFSLVYLRP